jgi:enoyl-CoA hydratase
MSNSIKTETLNGAYIIRFTRPEIRNPLSTEVLLELDVILDEISVTPKIVFTGTGGVFASGADLREIDALSVGDAAEFSRRGQALMNRIGAIRVPTVAAIDGPCFGGALDLALACKTRIASPDAAFCHPGAGLGIITGWGGTQRLPRLIGEAKALEMFFTAAPINSDEALRIGLIDKIAARVEDAI